MTCELNFVHDKRVFGIPFEGNKKDVSNDSNFEIKYVESTYLVVDDKFRCSNVASRVLSSRLNEVHKKANHTQENEASPVIPPVESFLVGGD